ncbi:MAG TPA: pitrilysin family protein, partial [Victivallales bacterium]|nr:pitrilysin family protein [Victivallales bacterium]
MKANIGDISSLSLDNGLSIFVCRNTKAPIATFQLWVQTGSLHEGKYEGSGISHFLEHMSFKGSKNYDKNQITSIMDQIGARINACTSYSKTIYYANCRAAKIAKAADVIMDIVRDPLFPELEFEKEKEVIARERAMYSDSPDSFLFEKMMQTMYLRSPMRHPIIGYTNMIRKVKCSDLFDYHKLRYRPEKIFIVVCGDVQPEYIFDIVKTKLDDWENNTYNEGFIYTENSQSSSRERSFLFKDPIARMAISFHSASAPDPMAPAFDVLSYILAGAESSRLLKKIQREEKLALSINSFNYSFLHGGIFAVTAACEKSRIEELKKSLLDELYAISRKKPPTESELNRAFTGISFSFLKSLKSINTIASLIGNSLLYYGDHKYALKYLDIIKLLDAEKIIYAAEQCLKEENSNIVTVFSEEKKEEKKAIFHNTLKKSREKIQIIKNANIPDILFLPDNDLPIFDICFLSKANHLFETIENAGISSIFTSTIRGGCKNLDEEKIMTYMDDNAIDLSFNESRHTISSFLSAPLESFDLSM